MFVFKTFLKTFQKMLDIIFRYGIMILSSDKTLTWYMKGKWLKVSIQLEDMFKKYVVYAIIDDDNKKAYIGQTSDKLLTRVGQHLDKTKTIKKYIETEKPKNLQIKVLYNYKRKHTNIRELLENKENYFMKEYSKKGYKLINISKMKKLGLA